MTELSNEMHRVVQIATLMAQELQLFVARVERDEQAVETLRDECLEFLGELEKLEAAMNEKMEAELVVGTSVIPSWGRIGVLNWRNI